MCLYVCARLCPCVCLCVCVQERVLGDNVRHMLACISRRRAEDMCSSLSLASHPLCGWPCPGNYCNFWSNFRVIPMLSAPHPHECWRTILCQAWCTFPSYRWKDIRYLKCRYFLFFLHCLHLCIGLLIHALIDTSDDGSVIDWSIGWLIG